MQNVFCILIPKSSADGGIFVTNLLLPLSLSSSATHTYSKLSETHGHERRTTLLHYLIQQMHRNQPQLLELPKHMEAISNASNGLYNSQCSC